MKETLQLSFLTSLNKTVHLQIQNPKTPIDPVAVNKAMDTIVSADIFSYVTGRIVKKVAAKADTTNATPITMS